MGVSKSVSCWRPTWWTWDAIPGPFGSWATWHSPRRQGEVTAERCINHDAEPAHRWILFPRGRCKLFPSWLSKAWETLGQTNGKQTSHPPRHPAPTQPRKTRKNSFIHSLPTKFNPRFTGPAWQIHCLPGYLPQPPPPPTIGPTVLCYICQDFPSATSQNWRWGKHLGLFLTLQDSFLLGPLTIAGAIAVFRNAAHSK